MIKRPRWTSEQLATAKRLLAEGASNEQCIAEVGRNKNVCWTKLYHDSLKVHSAFFNHVPSAKPKPEMLAEAYRRAMAPRTISAFVFGDPGKGHSALDRREERI